MGKSKRSGEESVLEGEIIIDYGKDVFTLKAGESIYYDSIVEHDVKAAGAPAKILAVIHEPA